MPIFDPEIRSTIRDTERRILELEKMFPTRAASSTTPSSTASTPPTAPSSNARPSASTSLAAPFVAAPSCPTTPAASTPTTITTPSAAPLTMEEARIHNKLDQCILIVREIRKGMNFPSSPASSTTSSTSTPSAPTSIAITNEPLQPLPVRCSIVDLTHDASATSAPMSTSSWTSATPTPPCSTTAAALPSTPARAVLGAEVDVFSTTPPRCSMFGLSRDSTCSGLNIITTESYSFECIQRRYIPAYPNGVVFPYLSTRVSDVQKVYDGMGAQNLVMVKPVPATIVVKEPEPYNLQFERIESKPKPPWPVICLKVDSVQGNFTQLCSSCWMLFSFGWVTEQQRPPWPPPKQPQLQCVGIQLRPTPWPSFDFLTVVQLVNGLSHSWHIVQLVNLHQDDSRLLYLSTESFQLVVHLLDPLSVVCVDYAVEVQLTWCSQLNIQFTIPWVSFCGLEYRVPRHILIRYQYHQSASELKYLHGNGINSGPCQLIMQSNSSVIECCKSSHIAVIIEVMAVKWVSQKMQYSVAWLFLLLYSINGRRTLLLVVAWQWNLLIPLRQTSSLVSQVGEIFVMPVTFVHVLFISSQNGMVVRSFLLLLLHYSSDYSDGLAILRSSNYQDLVVGGIITLLSLPVIRNWLSIDVQKTWRSVKFQFPVLNHLSLCELSWPPPKLMCVLDTGFTTATLSSISHVLFHCYSDHGIPFLAIPGSARDDWLFRQWLVSLQCICRLLWAIIQEFTRTKQNEISSLGKPKLIAGWFSMSDCSLVVYELSSEVIQIIHQDTMLIIQQIGWGCSSNGRTDIAQFFRLYSKPANHDQAQIHVSSDWCACTTYQTKPASYINRCTFSKQINISLRNLGVHCVQETLVRQWTDRNIHHMFIDKAFHLQHISRVLAIILGLLTVQMLSACVFAVELAHMLDSSSNNQRNIIACALQRDHY